MSGDGEDDLTGHWRGIFNYPSLYPPTEFEAELRETGGVISGVVSEPNDDPEKSADILHSVIEGRRDGGAVAFVKFYDDLSLPTPHYAGQLQAGGNEIAGEWMIPGVWSGTFIMIRASKEAAEAEQRISEKV